MTGVDAVLGKRGCGREFDSGFELSDPLAQHAQFGGLGATAPRRHENEVAGEISQKLELTTQLADQRRAGALDLLGKAGRGLSGADGDGVFLHKAMQALRDGGRGFKDLELGLTGAVDGGLCHAATYVPPARRASDTRRTAFAGAYSGMSDRAPIRRPAAFAPTVPPAPRCPVCWSAPYLGPARTVRRGWRVQAGEAEASPGSVVPVASTVYPCSNPACNAAIVVRMALTGGYLSADVEKHLLRAADAVSFSRGRTARDGIWRDRAGDPRTAPVQRELFAV